MAINEEYSLFGVEELLNDLNYVIRAHHTSARQPHKAYRKWDGVTPYSIHPIWCAMMILSEPSLADGMRRNGALALLYHDIAEDTYAPLPSWLSPEVKRMVEGMTFFGGSKEEMEKVWERPQAIRLLKLYDKVHNLLDGRNTWMPKKEDPKYRQKYEGHTLRLCADVERNYGRLNITKLARKILSDM